MNEDKKWFLITYRLVHNGPVSKWVGTALLFSEVEEDSLIKNTIKYLNNLEKTGTPVVESVEGLNGDGTKSLVLHGSVGSKIYEACFEFLRG